jgi:hypothetical protein
MRLKFSGKKVFKNRAIWSFIPLTAISELR